MKRAWIPGRCYFPFLESFRRRGVFLILILFSGCATYHPVPLTSEAVASRLQPPDTAALQVLARKIKHPILRPIELNPEEGLTPDRAAVLAVLLNPSLRMARDKRALSNAQLLDAGLLPNPELSMGAEFPSGGVTAGKSNAYGLGLNWDVTSLLTRGARSSQARSNQAAIDLDIAWQEWQTAQAAKSAVYQWAVLERKTDVAQQQNLQAEQNLARVRRAVSSGFLTKAALNAAQAARVLASENLFDLNKRALQQQLQLKRILGLPPQNHVHLADGIPLPTRVDPPEIGALLEGLEQRRLDLLALRRGYESQEEAVRTAVIEQFPKITLGPTFSRDSDKLQTVGFSVSIDLPISNQNQGRIAQARATRQMLSDEYAARVLEARSDVAAILSGMSFSNQQIQDAQTAERQTLDLVDSYHTALAEGRIDSLVYQAAWNEFADAQMRVLDLEGELAQAEVALQLATGLYTLPSPSTSSDAGSDKGTEGISP